MPDVKPAATKTDHFAGHVCPTCHQPDKPNQKAPMTGSELIAALQGVPALNLRHRIRLDLGAGGYAEVFGVKYGGGGLEGFWVALELGRVIGRNVDE